MKHTKECNVKTVKCTCNCSTGGHFLECAIVKIGCNCNEVPIDEYVIFYTRRGAIVATENQRKYKVKEVEIILPQQKQKSNLKRTT